MKKASLLMAAVLLLGGVMAAQQTDSRKKNTEILTAAERSGVQPGQEVVSNTCFTMRSYLFARADGEAPRLVGMTTCTPATRYRFYHAQRNMQFGFYPATLVAQPEKPTVRNSASAEPQ